MEMYSRKNIENRKWPRKILTSRKATTKMPRADRDTKREVQKRESIFKGYNRFKRM